jgi:hypothetical protein
LASAQDSSAQLLGAIAILCQPSNRASKCGVGYNAAVWQRFHILSRSQVFVVASASAAVIALAVALASIPADGTSWNRFLFGPSRQFDPFINFGSAFVSVLPVFLGYYHLARIGLLLGVAVSAAMCFATQVCAGFVFGFQLVGHSVLLQEVTYLFFWQLVSMIVLWVHIKASSSDAIRDAQRSLHLIPPPETSQFA